MKSWARDFSTRFNKIKNHPHSGWLFLCSRVSHGCAAPSQAKVLIKLFQKFARVEGVQPSSRSAERETPLSALFFLLAFSFAPISSKEKAADKFCEGKWLHALTHGKSLATFLFDTKGTKRKVNKREMPGIISRSAEREEGFAPSTCARF